MILLHLSKLSKWLTVGLLVATTFDSVGAADVPDERRAFFRYMIDRRTGKALERIRKDPREGQELLFYDGSMEDASMAWVMAGAYGADWSRWHKNKDVRTAAIRVATKRGWETGEIDGSEQPPQGLHWVEDYWHPRHLVINKTEATWQPGDRLRFGCAIGHSEIRHRETRRGSS